MRSSTTSTVVTANKPSQPSMAKRNQRPLTPALLLSLGACAGAHAQSSPWLPANGQFVATPAFSYSTFDEFWVGDDLVDPLKANGESLDQVNAFVTVEYGIMDRLAADVTIGYTQVGSTDTFGNDDDDGLADTVLGLRYRVLEETETVPVIAVRIGGIIAGTYEENTPFAPGDGANAFDGSVLLGKGFGDSGFGAYGEIGYRFRDNDVPDEFFASAGAYKQFIGLFSEADALTVSAGYRHIESTSGLDIGGPGFDPGAGSDSGFPALKEVNQLFEGAVGYTDLGGRHYQFFVATSLAGRNTGDKLIFGFSVSVPFAGP